MTELSPMNISTIPTLWTYLIFLHFSLQNYITPACSLSKEKGGIIVLLQPQQIGVLIFVIVSSSVVNLAKKKREYFELSCGKLVRNCFKMSQIKNKLQRKFSCYVTTTFHFKFCRLYQTGFQNAFKHLWYSKGSKKATNEKLIRIWSYSLKSCIIISRKLSPIATFFY